VQCLTYIVIVAPAKTVVKANVLCDARREKFKIYTATKSSRC
jgi:hypothetical protein